MSGRLVEFDILRSVATLAVIGIHTTAGYVLSGPYINSIPALLGNQALRFAVPCFFIISGFLLLSSSGKKEESWFSFMYRRFSKVFVPYLIWTVIYSVYFLHGGLSQIGAGLVDAWEQGYNFAFKIFIHLFKGNAASHLYFIVVIIQIYFLYPVLNKVVEKNAKLTLVITFLISFYFQAADYIYGYGLVLLPKEGFKYFSFLFFPWIFYFVLGMYLGAKAGNMFSKLVDTKTELMLLWVTSLFLLIMDSKISNTVATSIKPSIMQYSTISFFFLYSLSISIKCYAGLKTFFAWFASQSLLIYFCHVLVLTEIKIFAAGHSEFLSLGGDKGMVILFLAVSIMSGLLAYFLSFIPFINILGGVYRKTGFFTPSKTGDYLNKYN